MIAKRQNSLRGNFGRAGRAAVRRPPRSTIFFLLLSFAFPAPSQKIGPLVPDRRVRPKAAAARPPSLGLRLPAPAAAALPPLGSDDMERLRTQQGLTPVGVHRALPAGTAEPSSPSNGAAGTIVAGAWQATAVGRLWRLRVTSPGARALRVHFQDFDIGGGNLWLHTADGQIDGPHGVRGMYGDGDFWSGIVFGESATIEYRPDPASPPQEAAPFRIAAISHIWGGPASAGGGTPPAPHAKGKAQTPKSIAKLAAAEARGALRGRLSLQAKNGGPLTPGQPAAFRLEPVGRPTLFNGENSFRLEVPAGAERATFDLTSDDPSADVDLHVRFGQDNEVQDGRVLSDHSSTGSSGNERLRITRYSNPPLRAGTYYISLALYDTGAAAEGALTATLSFAEEQPPARQSGGPLAIGRPAPFRLGPVDNPTLFNGEQSFHLEFSGSASGLMFILDSVDPSADVDLFVRFGQDNALQDGRIVSDYSSRGASGNERILIADSSDPPLQAGTYYVSLQLYDTDAVAEGTLTAQEGAFEDCHPDVTCYPEWADSAKGVAQIAFEKDGASFICTGTLLNNRRGDAVPYLLTAAHCVDREEQARSVAAFWFYRTETCNGERPARNSAPRTAGASLLATLGGFTDERAGPEGDMTLLLLTGELPADVVFQGWDAETQLLDAQAAGIHHPGNDLWGDFQRIAFGRIVGNRDAYAVVSHEQGYTEPGSSGSAVFSSPGTVVGALSFGEVREDETVCPTGLADGYTRFAVFYPHIRQFLDSPPRGPLISSGGVVTATGAPIVNRISPNAIVSVFGQGFAPEGTQARSPMLDAAGGVAADLAETCLEIGGKRAPLFAVFPYQINAQVPHDLTPGGQARVEAIRGCGTRDEQRSSAEPVAVAAVSPAFFNFASRPDGRNPIAALHGGGAGLAGAPGAIPGAVLTPAQPGEFVSLFGTGFGPTEPALAAGQIPMGQARLANEVSFTFGGVPVPAEDVAYAGAAPCCAGLYQFTLRVPPGLPDGDALVRATVQGVSTPRGPFLAVRRR